MSIPTELTETFTGVQREESTNKLSIGNQPLRPGTSYMQLQIKRPDRRSPNLDDNGVNSNQEALSQGDGHRR